MIRKGDAPGAERRRQVTIARQINIAPEMASGIAYGVNCQCIWILPSRLIVQLLDRVPLHCVFLVGSDPFAEFVRFAKYLLEVITFGDFGNLVGFSGLVNFDA